VQRLTRDGWYRRCTASPRKGLVSPRSSQSTRWHPSRRTSATAQEQPPARPPTPRRCFARHCERAGRRSQRCRVGRGGATSRDRRFHSKQKRRSCPGAGATASRDGVGLLTPVLLLCQERGHPARAAPGFRSGRARELQRGVGSLPLATFAEVPARYGRPQGYRPHQCVRSVHRDDARIDRPGHLPAGRQAGAPGRFKAGCRTPAKMRKSSSVAPPFVAQGVCGARLPESGQCRMRGCRPRG
jgi:hypothetical protein